MYNIVGEAIDVAEGADLIYGYPGGAIMPIYDELYNLESHDITMT